MCCDETKKKMTKAYAFDFDGVILNSAEIKAVTYEEIFGRFPDYTQEMMKHVRRNAGFSRYVQFRYFFENVMGVEYDAETEKRLINEFSEKALTRVLKAPFIKGAMEFVRTCRAKARKTFIVTGTPQEEMLYIAEKKEIINDFNGIYGSPEKKELILERIIRENCLDREELIFFGDAMSDYESSVIAGVRFVGIGGSTSFPLDVTCANDFSGVIPWVFDDHYRSHINTTSVDT